VPRQETELVVEKCLEKMPAAECWAADLGTGSGVIAVTLAAERPGAGIVATDASAEALEVAERNAARHGVQDRVLLARGDLAEPVPQRLPGDRRQVELLVSNPPYVPTERIEQLQPEVRDHEPRAALDGGPDGLAVIRQLLAQAPAVLAPGGWLVLEVGESQADALRQMVAESGAFAEETIETAIDAGGCERVFGVRRPAR
ncbi:MAG: N5-glutamine methyltransferase family protein, partial [Planctomycetota bacterium]